jgi:hypothetical protein
MNRKFLGALVLMTVALVVNVNAQQKAHADVPFPFVVGNKLLPAATYDISQLSANSMVIRELDGGNGMSILFRSADADAGRPLQNRLVFHKYGDRYFLYQVWDVDGQGMQLQKSRREQEQAMRDNQTSASQEVAIALR